MKQKTARILSLVTGILIVASLFSWPEPVSAGLVEWSAETIPTRLDNILGPPGIDIRDFAVAGDSKTIYAVPGDSISDNVVFKSADAGATWTALPVPTKVRLVAVAPDDSTFAAVADNSTLRIYVTLDGGLTWYSLGTPRETSPAVAIYDIAVSAIWGGQHYIAAAGKDAGNAANLWYISIISAAAPTWQETKTLTGFVSGNETAAVAFSPSFVSDASLVAISDNANASVQLQMLDISSRKWNNDAGFINFPRTVVSNTGISRLTSASLSLAPTYLASDDDTRRVYIGLTVDGSALAIATSGIYRYVDTYKTEMLLNTNIHSIAYNGSYLVAGAYDTTNVYRSTNPTATTPTFYTSTTTKGPGGENRVVVAWIGTKVVAGTSGNESAFAISGDTGTTFNDISLVSTNITNARDVAVSADGSKVYFVTDDGSDLSLWLKTTTWQRVFSQRDTSDYIVRIEPQSASVIYLAKKGTTTIYYNSSSGATQWLARYCNINIQDLAVESTTAVYALNSAGAVSKTVNAGVYWASATATTLGTGATIVSVSTDTLLVGDQNGYVAYSTDGNLSWTLITQFVQSGAGNVQVIADEYFASNKIIYAASDTPGQNIKKWQIGTSTGWVDIFNGIIIGGIYGLAVNSNTLYGLEYDAGSGQSTIWRVFSPTTATSTSESWTYSPTTATTDINDPTVQLDAKPRALKVSSGKLWAVKTNGTNKLYSFTDIATELEIIPLKPVSGFTNPVNDISGVAFDVPFNWARPSIATEYELRISEDEDFISLVASIIVASEEPYILVMAGPHQTGNNRVDFMPGVTYYWKVRTTKPLYSLYSISRYFSIEPIVASVLQLLVPANGATDISKKPSFSWAPIAGTTEYQFILSTNWTMARPIVDEKVDKAGFKLSKELDYGKTYFWIVRATQPIVSSWSTLANFTVEDKPAEPVPPVIVQETPPVTINIPAPPPQNDINIAPPPETPPPVVPDYLITVIVIMGVLLLIVIVLIVIRLPVKLFPAYSLPRNLLGTGRKVRISGEKPGEPTEKPEIRAEVPEKPALPEIIAKRPATIDKASEGESVAFAAKSFIWLTTNQKGAEGGQPKLSTKEERSLGKKLSSRIQALAEKEPLYLKYPQDAALFLQIWARYDSRDETERYLTKSFRSRPENAIALLKCFLATPAQPETGPSGIRDFTRSQYDSLAEVINPDNVYKALTRLLKFKPDIIEGEAPIDPADRAMAYKFLRIHLQVKSEK
jgi:hypothetical protein